MSQAAILGRMGEGPLSLPACRRLLRAIRDLETGGRTASRRGIPPRRRMPMQGRRCLRVRRQSAREPSPINCQTVEAIQVVGVGDEEAPSIAPSGYGKACRSWLLPIGIRLVIVGAQPDARSRNIRTVERVVGEEVPLCGTASTWWSVSKTSMRPPE